jgi:hypothetical protein
MFLAAQFAAKNSPLPRRRAFREQLDDVIGKAVV